MNAPQNTIFGDGPAMREWWFHSRIAELEVGCEVRHDPTMNRSTALLTADCS